MVTPTPCEEQSHARPTGAESRCPKGPLIRTQKGPQTDIRGLGEHGLLAEQLERGGYKAT